MDFGEQMIGQTDLRGDSRLRQQTLPIPLRKVDR